MNEIDRIEPTRRPQRKNAGTQSWRNLLFVHWPVDIADLRPFVPSDLEIDTFQGQAYIALVPFEMRNIKPRWLPHSLAFNFLETNIRTYVVHQGRPGVYFFSLDANSRLAVWAARNGWSLPYVYAKMQSTHSGDQFSYSSIRHDGGGSSQVNFRVGSLLGTSQPGTLFHFLFERYLLFVQHQKRIYVGQVSHNPYEVYESQIENLAQKLTSAFLNRPGDTFQANSSSLLDSSRLEELSLASPGVLAHFSPGVDVEVFSIVPSVRA